ncbi:Homoserine O-acetyltransferase [Paraconexibacter sp. AEG42_29]|uniref:Homoserine O-succinyltransferase n=1 Tax=Paraconexibacter sp. AEG42_29 TaxID=2997339 RepID=A0AAU7AU21_9ACTN
MDGTAAVTTQRVVLFAGDDPLALTCGRVLAPVEVAFTTHGTLAADASNAVFVCHALTGDAHAAAPDGWWRTLVGPGLPVDTDRFFVITPNLLGGCRGTTGPSSVDPATGRPYGLDFPPLTIADLVAVHRRLLRHLGVTRLHAAIGGSLGGMQVLQWLLDRPDEVARAVMIGASARLSAQNVALSAAARGAILADPDFRDGRYLEHGVRPGAGLATARRLAHVTYLSEHGMQRRFAAPAADPAASTPDARAWLASRLPVEHYLDHQAEEFLGRFDALSYLYLSRVMDDFDPFAQVAPGGPDLSVDATVISFDSDWRFGPEHGARLAAGLRERGTRSVRELVLETDAGHDAFLLDVPGYREAVTAALGD